jgi:hypothetical protein
MHDQQSYICQGDAKKMLKELKREGYIKPFNININAQKWDKKVKSFIKNTELPIIQSNNYAKPPLVKKVRKSILSILGAENKEI